MTGIERMHAATGKGGVRTRERSQALRLFALVFALVAGLAIVLGAVLSAAQAAPLGGLKQFRVPTADSQPRHITPGADGNLWFTEGNSTTSPPNVGRITPAGEITEFPVCLDFCLPNDIVQGPGGVLYFTQNDPGLGRITTSGEVLSDVAPMDEQGNPITDAIGNGIAAHDNDIWFTDFNNNSLWRYDATSGDFTQFVVPTPGANPYDVAVDGNGIVWFTEFHRDQIGRLDPATRTFTETAVPGGSPRQIAIASDGKVWFTARFSNAVGYLDLDTNRVREFPLASGAGPEDIAAAADGALWVTQSNAGNIARITLSQDETTITISEGRSVKNSEPFGITIGPDGNPWYTMLRANKVATLQLR
jgi:streptogramin lyase